MDYTELMTALTAEYLNVFIARPKEDSADIIKLTGYVTRGINDKPQGFQYSKLLNTYAQDRIHPDDKDYFLTALAPKALLETFSDGRESLEYNYRIVDNGEIHHYAARYSRISKPDEDLRLVVAFRNIDFVDDMGQKKRNEGLYSAYSALSSIFFTLHRVDVINNSYDDIKTTAIVKQLTDTESNDYDTNAVRIISGASSDWSRAEALRFMDRATLPARMAGKTHISIEFLSYAKELCKLHFFKEDEDENGNLHHVIFAVEKVDEEKNQAVINALSRDFQNVFWIDLNDGASRTLKMQSYYGEKIYEKYNQNFFYDIYFREYISGRVHPQDCDRLSTEVSLEHLRKVFQDTDEFSGTFRILVDGEVHHYRYVYYKLGNLDSVVAGFRNIDDIIAQRTIEEQRKREEEQAHQNELKEQLFVFNTLARNFKNVYLINFETETAKILKLSTEYDELLKIDHARVFPFDAVRSEWLNHVVCPEDRDEVSKVFETENVKKLLAEKNEFTGNYRSIINGELHHFQYSMCKIDEIGNKAILGYQNIDEIVKKHVEQEKEQAEQQKRLAHALAAAQQASKAKSTFLNSMSHDIRTPMNAIIGFTALAQTHIDDKEQVQDYLAKISTSSTHLLSLINDILDMSRTESGTVKLDEKPVHMPDLLHDLRTMIQGLINSKNLNLYIDTQDVIHEDVITDKLRLNQVLINIVGNAIKFTQPGGDIIIRLLEKPCSMKNYTTYEFSVKDNGIGMSPDFLDHIFESFSREYSATVSGIQGTGLGMAITKNIVDMMGGEIHAESEEGKGSLFTVTVNLRLAAAPVKNEPIPALMGARALVVDDDIDTCRSVSKMLRDIKMRPDWTTLGREAVVRTQDATEMKDEYKVFIIDYLMPDMNGIETVRQIRRVISEEVPIIVLTAYDWGDFESEARQAGVTAFVSKPLFMSELREALSLSSDKSDTKDEASTAEKEEKPHYDYSGKHILLVEDNELNREIATALLEEMGIEVDTAVDGTEAVDIMYEADEDTYDLIFIDIQMPKMDGYTATHEIRTLPNNKKANIPIVAMTANAFDEDRKKSLAAGMNGHIVKPINVDDIAYMLDKIFRDAR